MVSALNPPTAWITSQICSSVNPYLNWSFMYLSSSMVSSPLPWRSYRLKLAPLPYSLNGFPWDNIKNYDSGSQGFQEFFEIQSVTWVIGNFVKGSEDNVVFLVEAQSFGGHEDVLDINSSLSRVGIKWEEGVDFSNTVVGEDGVLSDNILGEDSLEIFGLNLFSAHWI